MSVPDSHRRRDWHASQIAAQLQADLALAVFCARAVIWPDRTPLLHPTERKPA